MTVDIEQLLCQAEEDDRRATPGPWSVPIAFFDADSSERRYDDDQVAIVGPPNNGVGGFQDAIVSVIWYDGGHLIVSREDATFIAAARTREPLLAAALRAELAESARLRAELDRLRKRPPMGCSTCEDHNQTLYEENLRIDLENAELRKVVSEDKEILLESRNNLRNRLHEVVDELMFAEDNVDLHIDYKDAAAKVRGLVEKRRNAEKQLAAMTAARDEACVGWERQFKINRPAYAYAAARIVELLSVGTEQP